MRVAVYSANIGNYRAELNRIEDIDRIPGVDYYFFTDANISSKKWNVVRVGLRRPTRWLDAHRNTAKYCKWVVPQALHSYDAIIWVDSKVTRLLKKPREEDRQNYIENAIALLQTNPQSDLFFWRHPSRRHAREELSVTLRSKKENKEPGENLLKKIKLASFSIDLPDTCVIITRVTKKSIDFLQNVYSTLQLTGISRDQNIIQYCLETTGMHTRAKTFRDRTSIFPEHRKKRGKIMKEIPICKAGIGVTKHRNT